MRFVLSALCGPALRMTGSGHNTDRVFQEIECIICYDKYSRQIFKQLQYRSLRSLLSSYFLSNSWKSCAISKAHAY